MRYLWALPVLVCLGFLAACHPQPDGVDLNKVVEFYYAPGKKAESPKATYQLLSARSQTEISLENWVKQENLPSASEDQPKNQATADSAEVIKQEAQAGNTYALVMRTFNKRTSTNTWMQEAGKWHRLYFPKTQEEAARALNNGDYPAAYAKAQEWLKADPYAVEGYDLLAFSIIRGGAPKTGNGQTVDDVVRAVLSINPRDTTVNFIAATFTRDPLVAKTFLKRIEGTTSYSGAAMNLCLRLPLSERLQFLNEVKPDTTLNILRALTLMQLGPAFHEQCRALVATGTFEQDARKSMEDGDATYAANWGARLGLIALALGDFGQAQRWLDYCAGKDPNSKSVRDLAGAIRGGKAQMAASRLLLQGFN